jgi:peptidoglycan/LPS O-acetylase OafA/YrhL
MLALGVVLGFTDLWFRDRVAAFAARVGPYATPYLLFVPLALSGLSGTNEEGGRAVTGLVLPVTGWCFAALTLTAAHGQALPPTRGPLYRAWVFLGDRSYSIYLYHFPVMIAAWYVLWLTPMRWNLLSPTRYPVAHTAVSLVLLFPLVELVYRRVELPLTGVGRRLGERLRIIPADDAGPAVAGVIGAGRRRAA